MKDPIDNPYEAPAFRDETSRHKDSTRSLQRARHLTSNSRPGNSSLSPKQLRFVTAILLAVIGAPLGATLCSAGFLGVVMLLTTACVPPLHSPSNFGQFGFLVIQLGFYGLFYGASFGLIPYTRFVLWIPVFLLISWFTLPAEISANFDVTEVTCTAKVVIGVIIVLLAALTSFAVRICLTEDR